MYSSKFPEANEKTPLEYAKILHNDRIVTSKMIATIEHEMEICQKRIARAEAAFDQEEARFEAAQRGEQTTSATDGLIASQIAYVKKQLAEKKISKKAADAKIKKYKQMQLKLNRSS